MATIPSQKDTTFTKIFVGGLPYHTTDESLKNFFEQFGEIDEAVVITDRQSGKSRGYGFVTMSTKAAADLACKDPNPIIDGRKANVNLAYLGAKPRGIQGPETLSFPFALKAGLPGLFPTQYGLQPYMYAPTNYITSQGMLPLTAAGTPISPTAAAAATAGQVLDYTTASAFPTAASAGQQLSAGLAGYEAAAQYASAANYAAGLHPAAAYTYTVPQPLGLTATAAAHYGQPQQLQERMQ